MSKQLYLFVFMIFISLAFASGEKDFSINTPIVKAVVKEGTSINYPIDIVNINGMQEFNISYTSKFNFISIDKTNFAISKDEEDIFNIVLRGDYGRGVYVGKLIVLGNNDSIEIPVILEVESNRVFVDVVSVIAPRYFLVSPGEKFIADINVYNLEGQNSDIELEYYVSDLDGNIIVFKTEKLNAENVGIRKSFVLPENIEYGDYVFYVYVKQGDSLGTSSLVFNVAPNIGLSPVESKTFDDYFSFVVIMLVALIFVFIVFNHYWKRKLISNAAEWSKMVGEIKREDRPREIFPWAVCRGRPPEAVDDVVRC